MLSGPPGPAGPVLVQRGRGSSGARRAGATRAVPGSAHTRHLLASRANWRTMVPAAGEIPPRHSRERRDAMNAVGLRCLSVAALLATALLGSMPSAQAAAAPTLSVVASGLENPRGLTVGPDDQLYVAEGGLGGTQTTTPQDCQQVPPPVGPYSGGFTARISRINPR